MQGSVLGTAANNPEKRLRICSSETHSRALTLPGKRDGDNALRIQKSPDVWDVRSVRNQARLLDGHQVQIFRIEGSSDGRSMLVSTVLDVVILDMADMTFESCQSDTNGKQIKVGT